MFTKFFKLAASLALTSAVAHAVTVDFNAVAASIGASYTSGAVTFVPTAGSDLTTGVGPNGTRGLLGSDGEPYYTIRANIAGGTSSVSVDLGDFDQDADTIFLEIFSAANVSLGYTSQLLATSFSGMVTLNLSASNIAYAVFGSIAPSAGGSSVYADNFTYGAASTPDAGSTLALFAAGLGLVGVAARSRKSVR
ncbi:hypothetical protein [Horticoccus sp. 23ND18S-11]|uniref:hypothetical protein n=1 Tax=Horticoccus sp. 23ND18S-11 TaxID=3391832 RepID=UPI0039C90441